MCKADRNITPPPRLGALTVAKGGSSKSIDPVGVYLCIQKLFGVFWFNEPSCQKKIYMFHLQTLDI